MNALDLIILLILALFFLLGLRKGFIISLATLAGLILGIYAALHFSNFIGKIIEDAFHPAASWLPAISFTVTFLVVVLGVYLLGKLIETAVDLAGMSILNHILGGLFGLAKGILLVSVGLFLLSLADPHGKLIPVKTRDNSVTYKYVTKVFPAFMDLTKSNLDIKNLIKQ